MHLWIATMLADRPALPTAVGNLDASESPLLSANRAPDPWCNDSMRLDTARLTLIAPARQTWIDLLEGGCEPSIWGYPTLGDLIMARLVADGHLAAGEWGPWQIVESSTGLLIGGVGFKGAPDSADDPVEIGYGLAPPAQGHGYATEAVTALVDHAFARGVRQVIAETDVDNAPSAAVLRRVGFGRTELQHTELQHPQLQQTAQDSAGIYWHLDNPRAL